MIYVVGCNHGIQPVAPDPFDNAQALRQRAHFRELLSKLTNEDNIQFVGEEWGFEKKTIAHAIADEKGGILWENINTSHEDLDALGIPRNYANGGHSAEQVEEWHRQRECVMIKKIMEKKGDAESFIVICGFGHLESLTELLGEACRDVQSVDYRQLDWYEQVFAD